VSDSLTDSGDPAAVKIACTALSEIQKAIRFFRLYPKTHIFCVESSADSLERLQRYTEKFGKLSVAIQRDGCYLGEECVLQDSGQSTDLSALLYPEGVFGITFLAAVTSEEISDLCETLAASYIEGHSEDEDEEEADDEDAEDLLEALWDHEFEGILFKVQDPLAPAREPTGEGAVSRIAARIRSLVAEFHGEVEFSGVWEDRAGDHRVEAYMQTLMEQGVAAPASDPGQAASFMLSGEGQRRAALAAELRMPTTSDPGRAVQIIKWATENNVVTGMDEADLARIRMNAIIIALDHGQINDATTACSDLAGDERLSRALTRRLGSIKSLQGVVAGLEALDGELDKDQLIECGLGYLDLLDPATAMGPACSMYPGIANGNVRRVFRRFLSAGSGEHCEAIEPITLDADKGIAKEALGILAMGGKGTNAWELLKTIAKDTQHEYRSGLAQQVVGKVSGSNESEKLLAVIVDDADPARRVAAAKKLAKVGVPAVYAKLVEHVKSEAFGTRGNSEIAAVFDALSKTGGARSIVVLQELGKKKGFFARARGKGTERLRTLATNWLETAQADRRRKKKYGR
jgi:hypothetical protein